MTRENQQPAGAGGGLFWATFLNGYACGMDYDPDGPGFEEQAREAWEEERRRDIAAVAVLNRRELGAVLAALRMLEDEKERDGDAYTPGEIETDGGELEPLTGPEIDALCERINCGG